MERDFIALAIWLAGFAALCWIFRAKLTEFALFSAIVLTPLAHASFVPQQLFGLPGVNPVNVVWLFAAVCVLRGALASEVGLSLKRFFAWPLLVFGAVFLVAVLRTAFDVESLFPQDPSDRPSARTVLVFRGIKPIQYVLTGFLVCLYGIRRRTLDAAEKALLALPLVLVCAVVAYYAIGSAGAGVDEPLYKAGRQGISDGLAIHANYMGRMALYLLLFAASARNLPWRRVLPFSIFASVVLIELSFSRSVYVAGAILLPIALRRSSWRERFWVIGSLLVATLILYPQLSSRVQYGLESNEKSVSVAQEAKQRADTDEHRIDEISAGRTGRIWPLVWPNVVAHPWVGQGLLGVWKPVDRDRGLDYDHPHNAYLQVALDSGLVGLVALACLLWWIWLTGADYRLLRFVLAGWALMAVTGDTFYPHLQNSLNWIVLGMAVAVRVAGIEQDRQPRTMATADRPPATAGHPKGRRKICFVSNGAYPLLANRMTSARVGGAELQQLMLGEELIRRGYEVSFVTPDHGQGPDARLGVFRVFGSWRPEAGLPVIRFVYPRWIGLWRALARADADVYLVRTACKELATVAAFARKYGRQSIYCGATDSDFEPERLHLSSILERWLYLRGLRGCHAVVSQNEHQRDAVRDHFGRGSVVIHNGYAAAEDLGSGGDRVLWVATFRAAKQPHLLLEVAARLPHMQFTMVGGPSWGSLEDPDLFDAVTVEAKALGNVEICGALPLRETEAQFDRASVVVNTSNDEGFPNTFLQAWARGIPVVSFVDPDGLIRRRELGIVVEDVAGMVEALRDLAEERIGFSREAIREFFGANFTVEKLGDRYEEFFASLQPER